MDRVGQKFITLFFAPSYIPLGVWRLASGITSLTPRTRKPATVSQPGGLLKAYLRFPL